MLATNSVASAATQTWLGTDTDFENPANWSVSLPANDITTDIGLFVSPITMQPQLTTSRSISGLVLSSTGGGWTLSGSAGTILTIGTNGILTGTNATFTTGQSAGTDTISANLNLGASQTWAAGTGGILAISGSISGASGNVLTLGSAGNNGLIRFNGTSPNTYSGGTILNSGTIVLSANTGSPLGSGTLTFMDGVTLVAGSQINTFDFSVFKVLGNFILGGTTSVNGNNQRISFSGPWDLGGATRIVTLNKGSATVSSGNEVITLQNFVSATGTNTPSFQNGTIDFEAGPLASEAAPAQVRDINPTTFVNNAGLIIGPNVVWNQNSFTSGTGAPTVTLNGAFRLDQPAAFHPRIECRFTQILLVEALL